MADCNSIATASDPPPPPCRPEVPLPHPAKHSPTHPPPWRTATPRYHDHTGCQGGRQLPGRRAVTHGGRGDGRGDSGAGAGERGRGRGRAGLDRAGAGAGAGPSWAFAIAPAVHPPVVCVCGVGWGCVRVVGGGSRTWPRAEASMQAGRPVAGSRRAIWQSCLCSVAAPRGGRLAGPATAAAGNPVRRCCPDG